ncbi:Cytochrome p450 [Aspergillus sp. HF37]|nr:Cytochrome p450 [Aspergillus sp. HF37]
MDDFFWSLLALSTVSQPVIVFLAYAVYNVYLHPLRNFPGPRLWAATHLVWVYHRVTGQLVWKSVDLHRKYGSVVRVAPDQLSYTTETAWRTIYGHRPVEMQKNCLAGFSRPGLKNVHAILSADQPNHARLRRVLAPGLSENAVKEHELLVIKYANLLVRKLAMRSVDGPLDLNQWFEWTTLDLISDIVCGQPANALERENASPWLDILTASIQSQVWAQALEFYGLSAWRQYLLPQHMASAAIENFRATSARVDDRLARKEDHRDLFSYILRHNEQGMSSGMSPMEMKLNTATIIGAGTGTTATWLSATIHSLSSKRDAHRRVVEEIRSSFNEDSDITMDKVRELPYLAAVMKEALRMHSPSPSSLGRFVPNGGELIDGRFVPGGTTVGVHQHAAYHLPSNFYRADDFCPERWLPGARDPESPFSIDRLEVMQPFSYGPRTCLGIKLTQAETRVTLAKLLWHFDVEVLPESRDWRESSRGTVAWHRRALKCRMAVEDRK